MRSQVLQPSLYVKKQKCVAHWQSCTIPSWATERVHRPVVVVDGLLS